MFQFHETHFQLKFIILFFWFGISPPPPSNQIGNEKENLKKHIRIQLNLIIEEKRQRNVYDADRPAPDIGFSRKPNGQESGHDTEELQIAHGVIQNGEENVIDIEE